ncbi:ChbG/HpnK family deacetylase [Maricaulis sp.]|uniref:ChbG/HpnK family deacetylase n=1 Tax=Maricaulis sp. TaxID=1486257 RepID=UPI00329A085F
MIINADDFGLTDGVCRAIVELIDTGAVSSTTLMLAAEGSMARCRDWQIYNRAERVGVHLQLTSGRPLSPTSLVPTLVRSGGEFKNRTELASVSIDEVEREWRAQIDMSADLLGRLPTHLDSHHGVHHLEQFSSLFARLAIEKDVPVRDRTAMLLLGAPDVLTGSDVVLYDWTAKGLNAKKLEEQLGVEFNASRASDVIEVVTHPGYSDERLRAISALNDLRDIDRSALAEFSNSDWLAKHGARLVSFGEVGHRRGGPDG